MQAQAAENLARLLGEALAPLAPRNARTLYGPRRIAWLGTVAAEVPASTVSERGPKLSAPEQALAGFLRKHGATRDDLREDGGYWLLEKTVPGRPAAALIAEAVPALLRRFPWPKSMRWGGTSAFTWVRPLRRILCVLDGAVVPFSLASGEDDGHGLVSGDLTEGHRFLAPGDIRITASAEYEGKLRDSCVIADVAERRARIAEGITERAASAGYAVVPDEGLLDEVAGLVEWPVALLGRIDAQFMALPPEVRQVSMRVNQRYFALTDAEGNPAPAFVFAANIAATDGGAAIIAGNERVLRARLSDARHFWDLDRKMRLEDRVPALDRLTFHAKLGSQGQRMERVARLALEITHTHIAPGNTDLANLARRAGFLAKADLTSGMVGEFPELQGVMGRYYALHDNEKPEVADAIRDHYSPKGPNDDVPTAPISMAVALADKIDQLALFFDIGEKPTGSGDPFALRRAALGVIRIIRENGLRVHLRMMIGYAFEETRNPESRTTVEVEGEEFEATTVNEDRRWQVVEDVLAFIVERLRVQLRTEGRRHDVLAAAFAAANDDDLTRLLRRADAVEALLGTAEGADLLAAYRRAANILKIAEREGTVTEGDVDQQLLVEDAEKQLNEVIDGAKPVVTKALADEDFAGAMTTLAAIRPAVDAFFNNVTVNSDVPALRINRLRLLRRLRSLMDRAADFSRLETTGAA
jgi:glycyl-tRNA synthetase beta chain